jgi:hypothetical protein
MEPDLIMTELPLPLAVAAEAFNLFLGENKAQ